MSGFEAAASAAGLISLSFTLFKGCIQAFGFVETAAQLGTDADIIRCKLELEQYRLYQWAERVGLEDHPNRRLNWSLVANILQQLEALLTSSKEWKERYHLDIVELDKNALVQGPVAPLSRKSRFGILLARLRPNFSLTSSRIIQESNGAINKLEWAAVGKDKLQRLVADINYFNNCLNDLLESTDRTFITSSLEALLRDVVSRSNATTDLDVVNELLRSTSIASPEAVASAAGLKKIRLILGLEKDAQKPTGQIPASASDSKALLRALKPIHLVRESPSIPPFRREFARYRSKLVLVEWKHMEKRLEAQLKHRIDHLAILLGNVDETSFHSLRCLGILPKNKAYEPEDDAYICYGLVFELRKFEIDIPLSTQPAIATLCDLYARPRKPSLNERKCISLSLAETVLQLHTAGWLHKGLRSDNILYLDLGNSKWEDGTAQGPFLAGYDYARPSNADTEKTPESPELELYRHPLAQGPARPNFNKSFDLFALGCVLLELALWRSLKDVLTEIGLQLYDHRNKDRSYWSQSGYGRSLEWMQINEAKAQLLQNDQKGGQLADVAFHAGETFKEVILLCLYASHDDPDDEDLEIQKLIVEKLKDCRF